MEVICRCGCGGAFTASRATEFRIKRGDPVGYLPGHRHRMAGNVNWIGGRIGSGQGYVLVQAVGHPNARKSGYILEHRLVMSNHLGRALLPTEDVHHKNENRSDNRLDNLELLNHTKHVSLHSTGSANARYKPPVPKACPTCGISFFKGWKGNQERDRFCSRACIRGTAPKGTAHHNSKLTPTLVLEIRRRAKAGETHQSIADHIGFNRRQISKVVQRLAWAHIT